MCDLCSIVRFRRVRECVDTGSVCMRVLIDVRVKMRWNRHEWATQFGRKQECVCVCVCACACACVRVHVRMCMRVHVRMCMRVNVRVRARVHVHVRVCAYACTCACTCESGCTRAYAFAYAFVTRQKDASTRKNMNLYVERTSSGTQHTCVLIAQILHTRAHTHRRRKHPQRCSSWIKTSCSWLS